MEDIAGTVEEAEMAAETTVTQTDKHLKRKLSTTTTIILLAVQDRPVTTK